MSHAPDVTSHRCRMDSVRTELYFNATLFSASRTERSRWCGGELICDILHGIYYNIFTLPTSTLNYLHTGPTSPHTHTNKIVRRYYAPPQTPHLVPAIWPLVQPRRARRELNSKLEVGLFRRRGGLVSMHYSGSAVCTAPGLRVREQRGVSKADLHR